VQIWLLTCHVRQLQRVNYGIVVGLKTLKCQLQRLKKAKRNVKNDYLDFTYKYPPQSIHQSNTKASRTLRTLRRLIWEKCQVEVSSAADSQTVLAERADGSGWITAEGPQTVVLFDQWTRKNWSKRQARAAVSRAARDVARNRHINSRRRETKKEKKGESTRPSEPLPCRAPCFFSHQLLSPKAEETTPFRWSQM